MNILLKYIFYVEMASELMISLLFYKINDINLKLDNEKPYLSLRIIHYIETKCFKFAERK